LTSGRGPAGDPGVAGPIAPSRRGLALGITTVLALTVWLVLSVANAPLRNPVAPAGMISFEFARTAERAAAIIASWGPKEREAASFSLGLDFLFLALYPAAISLAVRIGAERLVARSPRWALTGMTLSIAVVLCVALDAIENAALWRMLQLGPTAGAALVASVAAALKFALVAVGFLYALASWALARAGGPAVD